MSAASYVPYQAYKSKRHSRVVSTGTPLLEPNVAPPAPSSQTRHYSSNSLDLTNGTKNGVANRNGDDARLSVSASTSPEPSDVPYAVRRNGLVNGGGSRRQSMIEMPTSFEGLSNGGFRGANVSSEPTSPVRATGPTGVSIITPSADEENYEDKYDRGGGDTPPSGGSSSPRSTDSRLPTSPTISSHTPSSSPNGTGATPSSEGTTQSADAGPSKPAFAPRKSSTFRYVPLRNPSGSTTPRTSSPLRPPGTRTSSSLSTSSKATLRSFDNNVIPGTSRPPVLMDKNQSTPTPAPASTLAPPSSQPGPSLFQSPTPIIPTHARSSSFMALPPHAHPQRTFSSLSSPPLIINPHEPLTSPSPPPNSTLSSPRMKSPAHSGSPTPIPSSSRAAYRPGFQPKGVYRPLTDDFVALRAKKQEVGRVERTRLERRLEKLIELHFPKEEEKEKGEVNGKGKEKSTPPPAIARRASSFFDIDFSDLRSKSASDIWKGVLESRAAAANGGKGDVRAAEQRITPWQDDADVSSCPHCSASFHPLTNRKHHCRLCGRIICSLPVKRPQRPVPCSLLFVADPKTGRLDEVSEVVDYGVRPRSRTDIVNGKGKTPPAEEKFLKGVRICRECKPVILRQQYRQDSKRSPLMVRLYDALVSVEGEIEEALPHFQELMLNLANNVDEAPTKDVAAARKRLVESFADYDALAKRLRKLPCPGGPGSSQDRVQNAIMTRASLFLQKNLIPLQSVPMPKKRAKSDSTASVAPEGDGNDSQLIDLDSELAQALQPLLEQEALLESFIEEAKQTRKFEDAKTLKTNLGEIRAEIDRVVAAADEGASPVQQQRQNSRRK